MPPPIIGVAGGIGAGKSSVSAVLAALGCKVIDADRIGHEVLKIPEVKAQMVAEWGPGILKSDGEINRRAVAEIVFRPDGDERAHHRLTEIGRPFLWTRVRQELEKLLTDPAASAGIVLDAALLFESGLNMLCCAVIFVDAPIEVRTRRVAASRGWPVGEIERRETYQRSRRFKLESSDYQVDNSGTPQETAERVRAIYRKITGNLGNPAPENDPPGR
jgi:dephospho-CoA kinase